MYIFNSKSHFKMKGQHSGTKSHPPALNLVSVCIAILLCVICAPMFMGTAYAVDIPNSGDISQ